MIDDPGLRTRLQSGNRVTLVLGAGVSRARGVPLWTELLRETWNAVYDRDPYDLETELLERARQTLEREGLPKRFLEKLDIRRHPLEAQFAFEQIYSGLRWQDGRALRRKLGLPRRRDPRDRAEATEQDVAELFTEILRKVLYRSVTRRARTSAGPDTLSLVAEAVRQSAMSPENSRRIAQVITFNVDDLLEREVNGSRQRRFLAQPICRASDFRPVTGGRAIAIYHLHGFVPMSANSYPISRSDGSIADAGSSAESLVFTDEQYWRMVGNPTGFASRIFCNALSDCCVFIGLSMTDINIIRWLAQDAIERGDDLRRRYADSDVSEVDFDIGEDLSRHYWITPGAVRKRHRTEESARAEEESMRLDVVANLLARRGVSRITIPAWDSPAFHDWWKKCFCHGDGR